ncbi:CHAT domain-containing protein [Stieleria varia]|uniref:CHAT domain protein n=1 Tax=Stieleria varia TaxID=2528005 RepID=A0A5C6B8T8_9BACT|nr:CHAT domain-containing protein [Stieleria varia]TWU07676.1 CHAT domain protein [Stieleria varia]
MSAALFPTRDSGPSRSSDRYRRSLRVAAVGWLVGCLVGASILASGVRAQNPVTNGTVRGQLGGVEVLGTYPPDQYYQALEVYRDGDLDRAVDAFDFALGSTRRDINGRWLDSIPVLAMLGECYYQGGDLESANQAVEQAINVAIRYRGWLSNPIWQDVINPGIVTPNSSTLWPQAMAVKRAPIARRLQYRSGRVLTEQELARGGVFEEANIKTIDVVEIMRGLALASYRRRVIQGELAANDVMANQLIDSTRYPAGLQVPVALNLIGAMRAVVKAGASQDQDALKDALENRVSAAGAHPLSPIVGLTQAYLMAGSKQPQAAVPIAIATANQAAAYEQYEFIGEALQLAAGCVDETTAPAVQSAAETVATSLFRKSRFATLHCLIVAADAAATSGQLGAANNYLTQARALLTRRDVIQPRMQAYANYVAARVAALQNATTPSPGFRDAVSQPFTQMNQFAFKHQIRNQSKISMPRLFQIARVSNAIARNQAGQASDAVLMAFSSEPSIETWRRDPVDALAALQFDREPMQLARLRIAASRTAGDDVLTLQDELLASRARKVDALGGRLLQVRTLARSDDAVLGKEVVAMRNKAPKSLRNLRDAAALPLPGSADAAMAKIEQMEATAWSIALDRQELPKVMPPQMPAKAPSGIVPEHVGVMTFLSDGNVVHVTFASAGKTAYWTVPGGARLGTEVSRLLRSVGVGKPRGKRLPEDDSWRGEGLKLWRQLLPDPALLSSRKISHLVIVPDSVLWYVPFEILQASEDSDQLLGEQFQIHYAATPGLAMNVTSMPHPNNKIAMAAGKFFAPRDLELNAVIVQSVQDAAADTVMLGGPGSAGTAWLADSVGHLMVGDQTVPNLDQPAATSLAPYEKTMSMGTLESWLRFPGKVVESVALFGFRTPVDLGQVGNGRELFHCVASLQCAGVRSVLLSRWIVGGESTALVMREYAQELPFIGPSDAWTRARGLLRRSELDPSAEPTLMQSEYDREGLTGDEPFFWSGYLLASPLTSEQLQAP